VPTHRLSRSAAEPIYSIRDVELAFRRGRPPWRDMRFAE
jgi:hypothetical protein